ncbi:unnamed protein product, partial [Musa acuminata subsp. burmannicoides]
DISVSQFCALCERRVGREEGRKDSSGGARYMEFRARDYEAEEIACAVPRQPAPDHPLALLASPSSQVLPDFEVCFDDPLRGSATDASESILDQEDGCSTLRSKLSGEADNLLEKEWIFLKSSLMQKFSCSNTITISPTTGAIMRNNKGKNAGYKTLADIHMEDLDDPESTVKEEIKVITRQEYVSRLQELKGEINQAWIAEDRIRALKLSIKVARLLTDTSVCQFYPTLFTLVVDVMDMLGNLVWERIKKRTEYADDRTPVCSLPENFTSDDICSEAKETCYNWFCKIGSIHELVPRIYLELAILRCWRFLEDSFVSIVERLVMMMRGLADPLVSAYCHLYLAHCARSLYLGDDGYLIMSLGDISILLRRVLLDKETVGHHSCKNKYFLISLIKPAIDWIVKCIFTEGYQNASNILVEFGVGSDLSVSTRKFSCVSVVLHYLLKHLPADVISNNAVEIIDFIEQNKDMSVESHLDYRLLGHKLYECQHSLSSVCAVMRRIMQVLGQYDNLNEYLIIADAYLDIILLYSMENYLGIILDGILKRAHANQVDQIEMENLQSILVKIIDHFDRLEVVLAMEHFTAILDFLSGSSRNTVYMNILHKATRAGHIGDPTRVQFLFEVSQVLHESIDTSNMNDESKHKADLISRFVGMVNFGAEWEQHLSFLGESRAAFGSIDELKYVLIHSSNNLAIKSIRDKKKFLGFLKSCLAFSEVTIPSISDSIQRMNLYLETAEIALFGGLISHSEGLVTSAISCLECLNMTTGSHSSNDVDHISSLTSKLCSLLLMIPGNHEEGSVCLIRNLIATLQGHSLASSKIKVQVFCAIISLSAGLSQKKFLYHAKNMEVISNDQLYFGDPSFDEELSSIASLVLQILEDVIKQEMHLVTRGRLALDACNCLLVSFKTSHELSLKCSSLIDIAESCLHPKEKYLRSTVSLMDRLSSNLGDQVAPSLELTLVSQLSKMRLPHVRSSTHPPTHIIISKRCPHPPPHPKTQTLVIHVFSLSPPPLLSSSMALRRSVLAGLLCLTILLLLLHGWSHLNQSRRRLGLRRGPSTVPRKLLSSRFDLTAFDHTTHYRHHHHHRHRPHRHHRDRQTAHSSAEQPSGDEIDPRYGVEKRIVPMGPNPLHH